MKTHTATDYGDCTYGHGLGQRWWSPNPYDNNRYTRDEYEREMRAYEEMIEREAVAERLKIAKEQQAESKRSKPCKSTAAEDTVDKKNVSKKDEETKKMASKTGEKSTFDSIVDTVTTTTKEDAVDASWRTAAAEATEIAKPVAKQILKEVGGTFAKPLIAGIDTPIGTGAVSWVTGWAIMGYGPLRGKELGPKTMRLSKELRIAGIQPLTNALAKRFIAPMRKRLTTLLEDLPSLVGES